jgi:molecular chaperone DnaK (HSP70)
MQSIGLNIGSECTKLTLVKIDKYKNKSFYTKICRSMVSFTENGITIGEPPADAPLSNTIYDFLRLAGRKYSDPSF